MTPKKPFRLRVEGWRGINQSYALVNQYQLLELRNYRRIALSHEDVPFIDPEWSVQRNDAGFDEEQKQAIAEIPAPDGGAVDAVYRISFPFRTDLAGDAKVSLFVTSENHKLEGQLPAGADIRVRIITPSRWSMAGLIGHGVRPENISVVPLGIDPGIFFPLDAEDRRAGREWLSIPQAHTLFLNVSAMTFNKGVDKAILAFCHLKQRHPDIALVLKDQRNLYGITSHAMIQHVAKTYPSVATQAALDAIHVLPENLSLPTMRMLYGCADAYLSPYRAEGFNLPPLEAAACGVPAIVTSGGATDDYYDPSFAMKVASSPASSERHGSYLEPDLDSLIEHMERIAASPPWSAKAAQARADWVCGRFSWESVTARLVHAVTGQEAAALA
jgi:glycosyltransferase involved in cell wall biosynthesis